MKPLEDLLRETNVNNKKKCVFIKWNSDHQSTFDKIKSILTSDPILAYPTREDTFILDTDASFYSMGCVLIQVGAYRVELRE